MVIMLEYEQMLETFKIRICPCYGDTIQVHVLHTPVLRCTTLGRVHCGRSLSLCSSPEAILFVFKTVADYSGVRLSICDEPSILFVFSAQTDVFDGR
jgi:hypothetical protein